MEYSGRQRPLPDDEAIARVRQGTKIPARFASANTGHHLLYELIAGTPRTPVDDVRRVTAILETLDEGFEMMPADCHDSKCLTAVHDEAMLAFLLAASKHVSISTSAGPLIGDTFPTRPVSFNRVPRLKLTQQLSAYCNDTFTAIGSRTYSAARSAADVALSACDDVLSGCSLSLALCRPPGHHAASRSFGGGCYLNNAAIAADYIGHQLCASVAVVDLDFHHGNGTQEIFFGRDDVFYVSLHGDPDNWYPYYSGLAEEIGEGDGVGTNMNLVLPPKVGGAHYRRLLATALEAVQAFAPEAMVVSFGADTLSGDPTGDGRLTLRDMEDVGRDVGELGLRCVVVLEGGYQLDSLGPAVSQFVSGVRRGAT